MFEKQNRMLCAAHSFFVAAAAVILILFAAQIANSRTGAETTGINDGNRVSEDLIEPIGEVITYTYPRISPKSASFKVKAGSKDIFVYNTSAGDFAAFACTGIVEVEIETQGTVGNVRIAPARHGIEPKISGNRILLRLQKPVHLLIEIDGLPQLYLYCDAPDPNLPAPTDPKVRFFANGQVYEVGELRLGDNETLYIEGGAVVRGCIRATSARGVRIAGRGVLDGSYYRSNDRHRSIVLEGCRDSRVDDIIMIEPTAWMIMLGLCQDVTVRNVKQLGSVGSSDGVDIVGSRRIRVEDCFCRNGDDCIAIKSLDLRPHDSTVTMDYSADVEDIEISGCAFIANIGGQALEIGHELRTASVRNIRFRDCDILGVHGYGAPFGIHNADRAMVSDVLYEDIRVEHYYNKLIEFRVVKSRWSKDEQRGQIRNVTLRNIDVTVSIYNPGYSCSVIGGLDARHTIEHVHFENFRLNGKAAASADDVDLYCKQTKDVTFR